MNHDAKGQTTLTTLASAVHAADGSSAAPPHHRPQRRQVHWYLFHTA